MEKMKFLISEMEMEIEMGSLLESIQMSSCFSLGVVVVRHIHHKRILVLSSLFQSTICDNIEGCVRTSPRVGCSFHRKGKDKLQ